MLIIRWQSIRECVQKKQFAIVLTTLTVKTLYAGNTRNRDENPPGELLMLLTTCNAVSPEVDVWTRVTTVSNGIIIGSPKISPSHEIIMYAPACTGTLSGMPCIYSRL